MNSQVHFCALGGWSVPPDPYRFADFFAPLRPGSIPESLGNLVNLEWLDLANNQLSGPFFLSFSGRSVPPDRHPFHAFLSPFIAGTIPESLGQLENLQRLYLNNNELTGPFLRIRGVVSPARPPPFC